VVLSPTEEAASTHLEELGRGKKLVIAMIAHDPMISASLSLLRIAGQSDAHAAESDRSRESVKYQAASLSLSGSPFAR